jgi:hypothetical protein
MDLEIKHQHSHNCLSITSHLKPQSKYIDITENLCWIKSFEFPFMNYQVFIMASLQDRPKNMWCLDKIIKISTNFIYLSIYIYIMKMFFNSVQNNNLIIRLSNMMHPFWVYCHVNVCSNASNFVKQSLGETSTIFFTIKFF